MKQKSTYSEKLKDPRWQKKRLEILQRDEFTCQRCFDNESTLHVHHRRYNPNSEPWEINNDSLVTLCESCHAEETDLMPEVTHDLIAILKDKFFARDMQELCIAFLNVGIYYDTNVTASIINHWLSKNELFGEMGDRYFQYLKEKNKKDRANKGEVSDDLPF